MSVPTSVPPEVLRVRPRPWLRRLWVRISLVLLLICAISAISLWSSRRTKIAIWWVGGQVSCQPDNGRAGAILNWFDPSRAHGLWKHHDSVSWILGWASEDRDITRVFLSSSKSGDECLRTLGRCPRLIRIVLHDRQLGPGLEHLRDCEELFSVTVHSASNRHLAELRWLMQIEEVVLNEPQSGDLGLDSLTALPKFKLLFVNDCRNTGDVLAAMPELPKLESLVIQNCTGFVDDDFRHLQRQQNLKGLGILGQTPLGDVALEHLSQLESLEGLGLRSPWPSVTHDGLRALSRMKSLKHVDVEKSQCTAAQLQMLRDQLPNCTIRAY